MLEIRLDEQDAARVVRLAGRMDGTGAAALDRALAEAPSGPRATILDLGAVSFLSSAGIRSLLRLAHAQPGGWPPLLVGMQPFVAQTIEVAGLLDRFARAPTVEAALCAVADRPRVRDKSLLLGGRAYEVARAEAATSTLVAWVPLLAAPTPLVPAHLDELGIALGVGGLGVDRPEALLALGPFLATGRVFVLLPADGANQPDHVACARPAEALTWITGGVGLAGEPAFRLTSVQDEIRLGDLARDAAEAVERLGQTRPVAAALLITGESDGAGLIALAVACPPTTGHPLLDRALAALSCHHPGGSLPGFHAHGVLLRRPLLADSPAALDAALGAALADESPRSVICLAPYTPLRRARAWVYLSREIAAAADRRVRIQVRGGGDFPDEWEVIAGRLYRDCAAVTLTPLTGGYSAATFQATSTDREGRRLLPTVLKISSLAFTDREERAHHAHVRPFILNNSAVIMGRATHGSSAGLKYNFLGIAGPDTRLSSLGDHVARRPVGELVPILDALCLRILWPWYGQARDEKIFPFVEHEPRGLFPDLVDDAARHLGVSPDAATIPCPELGRPLPNPYRALCYDYPARREETMAWRTSITHGDLNLNNVLLDEKENLYVIDFSETARRNAVADFARLETLLVLQTTRLTDERDLRHLVEFIEGLLRVATLGQSPPLVYRGDDPAVEKAYHLVCLLRGYAAGVAPPSGALLPYLMPLLQWTLPLVSFRQLETPRRRLSMLAAALAWERLGEA